MRSCLRTWPCIIVLAAACHSGTGHEGSTKVASDLNDNKPKQSEPANADDAYQQAAERAVHAALTTAGFLNMTAVFAAPRYMAKAERIPSREEVLRCIDAYLEVLSKENAAASSADDDQGKWMATKPHAEKLRELFALWSPSPEVPMNIVSASRAVLAAFGVPEPPGGWDAFEGFNE